VSNEPIIKVEGLSKKYLLNKTGIPKSDTLYGNIRNSLQNFKNIAKKKETEEFWALQNVSFDIHQGDRVGIIGRNGAGKSTLLKILSRITPPTKGRVEISGRLASLLEVGTGFHGDLSGRENIYLNGSILGMSKHEIDRKFDEIVAFAEVEQFLDTPVKRYSSGMYVRLAFAVAAHLEPEILIVDEVLAVGDAAFQKKCIGKMKDVSNGGRTILFVSHSMASIQNLCDKCLYLKNGEMITYGKTEDVIPVYLRASQEVQLLKLYDRTDRSGNGKIKFTSFNLKNNKDENLVSAQCGDFLNFELEVDAVSNLSNVIISLGIDDSMGQRVTHFSNEVTNQVFEKMETGKHLIDIKIPKFPLKSGEYTFTLFSTVNGDIADWIQEAGTFTVESGDFYRSGKLPPEGQGSIFIEHSFSLK
jgi:lipopolysaccharide transport system ATP-binding protein